MKKKPVPSSPDNAAPSTTKRRSPTESSPQLSPPLAPDKGVKTIKHADTNAVHKTNSKPFTIVAIGASAGGLEAVTQLLENLTADTGMAFIYVQHLSPDHKSLLTSLLSRVTAMKVQEIDDMEKMVPNNVYVIPYNKEIEVMDGHIQLLPRPQNKSSNLSIDVLFSSLAETHKENVIGIVLSGSASDGTEGLKAIKLAGGITFAQDKTAKFSSMPESAIAKGVVDFILSPMEIAREIVWISEHPLSKRTVAKTVPENQIENNDPDLKIILELLKKTKRVDFSFYKMNTIKRRMLRRMLITKADTLKQYAAILETKNGEIELLYQDLLINVTDFFRDVETFQYLKSTVLPRLLKSKAPGETMRIWVAACATGEEVYSLAMMLIELRGKKTNHIPFQIFGTDLSAKAIQVARQGEYTAAELSNVSAQRQQQFFTKVKDKFRIAKTLRDVCVFAQHNILGDPPFSRMDFISCRNFLIYLDTSAQKKAISTFHYALNEGGCLMLGKSETLGGSSHLFTGTNKPFKIFFRKKNTGAYILPHITLHTAAIPAFEKGNATTPLMKKTPILPSGTISSAYDSLLLEHFMPASVVINQELEILQFRGNTSLYLQHTTGKASFNILKMAHLEITFELRTAIHQATKTNLPVRKSGIEMNRDANTNTVQIVNIDVLPMQQFGYEPMMVVVFTGHQVELTAYPNHGGNHDSLAKTRRIKKLEAELAAARADMGAITHDQETTNEELQSVNEEINSSNEELQSLNEELETSKEEIESTNEELTTSNQELHTRIQQIEELNQYNETILATVHEPVLILDKNIRIKSANKSFCKTFRIAESDCIGVSLFKLWDSQWNVLRLREMLENVVPKNIRFHDFELEQVFPSIGPKNLLLNAHRIVQQSQNEELIVLTISDITKVKRLASQLQQKATKALEIHLLERKKAFKIVEDSNKRYSMMFMQSPFAFSILKGKEMVVMVANDSMKEIWGKGKKVEGKSLAKLLPELKDQPYFVLLDKVYSTGLPYNGYEMLAPLMRHGKLTDAYFNFVYQPYREADETISGVAIIAYEVTEHVLAKNELVAAKSNAEHKTELAETAVKAKQQFLSNMSHEIRTPMNAIVGFTNVLLKTLLDDSQRNYLNAIKVSGDALIVLVNDILDLAKVDAGRMTFEHTAFHLVDTISIIIHLFDSKIKEKNLVLVEKFDQQIPRMLFGDPMRLRQIIINLLGNAVKFTEEGEIKINVQLLHEDADTVTIKFTLTDTGIGIPKDKLPYIFTNFDQAGRENSGKYGGTGLGLAIVKQLVELQEGTIIVNSKLGKGSTFGFILGFAKVPVDTTDSSDQAEQSLSTNSTPQKVHVLVAEDMPLNQLLIKIILNDFGFEIDVAENGLIAIEMLKRQHYDIILMDLQMPKMNGIEATDHIRNTMHLDIPIIALTADVTNVDGEKCLAMGMNDYISKPIDEKLLYNKMMQCIQQTNGGMVNTL